jgi:hypothetical protein
MQPEPRRIGAQPAVEPLKTATIVTAAFER